MKAQRAVQKTLRRAANFRLGMMHQNPRARGLYDSLRHFRGFKRQCGYAPGLVLMATNAVQCSLNYFNTVIFLRKCSWKPWRNHISRAAEASRKRVPSATEWLGWMEPMFLCFDISSLLIVLCQWTGWAEYDTIWDLNGLKYFWKVGSCWGVQEVGVLWWHWPKNVLFESFDLDCMWTIQLPYSNRQILETVATLWG